MTRQDLVVRSSMNNLVQRERESNVFKDKMQQFLDSPMSMEMRNQFSRQGMHISGRGDLADGITAALTLKALHGDVQAYAMIRDTMGYKPVDQVRNDVIVRIDMSPKAKELGE